VVVYAGNPPQALTVRALAVDHGPVPAGLVLLAEPDPVSVTVDGLHNSIGAFKRESLHASIDLASAHRGANLLPVRVDNADPTVTVRDIQPASVRVDLDQLGQVTRKVEVRQIGHPDACCAADPATASPDSVVLRGPQSLMETAVAYAEIDVTSRQATVQQQVVSVKFETPAHKALTQITASPSQVAVTVQINPVKVPKTVAVQPALTGALPPGFHIDSVDVSPLVAVVEADPATLAQLRSVPTDAIPLDGHTTDFTATGLHLRPPAGVGLVSTGTYTVRVTVKPDAAPSPSPSPSPSPAPSPSPSR
jgi:YbbR domain-containing protein